VRTNTVNDKRRDDEEFVKEEEDKGMERRVREGRKLRGRYRKTNRKIREKIMKEEKLSE
jgi:hypothetical protein